MASNNKGGEVQRDDRHQVVAVRSDWARYFGTITAIWLSQAVFTQTRKGEGNWWYKNRCAKYDDAGRMMPPANNSDQSFEYETGLTRSQQETARAVLKAEGALKERLRGIPKRVEYLIVSERLRELEKEWDAAGLGVSLPTAPQDITVQSAESTRLEGEIEQSSTETLQKTTLEGSSRSSAARQKANFASRPRSDPGGLVTRLTTAPGGIQCWTDDDRENARGLLEKFGEEKVTAAVKKIEGVGESPLPSRVRLALSKPTVCNDVDRTTEMMERYNDDETRKIKRGAAQRAIRTLTRSRLDEFRCLFFGQNAKLRATSLDQATGKWTNLAARLQFDRWLENQFMNDSSIGG